MDQKKKEEMIEGAILGLKISAIGFGYIAAYSYLCKRWGYRMCAPGWVSPDNTHVYAISITGKILKSAIVDVQDLVTP